MSLLPVRLCSSSSPLLSFFPADLAAAKHRVGFIYLFPGAPEIPAPWCWGQFCAGLAFLFERKGANLGRLSAVASESWICLRLVFRFINSVIYYGSYVF